MNKSILFAVFFISFSLINSSIAETRTYTMATCFWSGMENFIIADKKGFYKKYGLDIKVLNYSDMGDFFNALYSDRFDFRPCWLISGMEFDRMKKSEGKPGTLCLGAVSMETGEGQTLVVAKKGMTTQEIGTAMIATGTDILGYKIILHKYLKSIDSSLEQVRLLFLGEDICNNFLRGRVSVVQIFRPKLPLIINNFTSGANGKIVSSSADFPEFSSMGIVVSRDNYKTMPKEDIKNLWKSLIDTQTWKTNHEKEYRKIIMDTFGPDSAMGKAHATNKAHNHYKNSILYFDQSNIVDYNTKNLKIILQGYKEYQNDLKETPADYENLSDISILKEAVSEY